MASFVDDLGEALETALKANSASFSGAVGSPGGTLAIFYNDTPEMGNAVMGSHCYLRFEGMETLEDYEGSARSVFNFVARFELTDLTGKNKALGVVTQGMKNTFANDGRSTMQTFTDNGGNNLAEGGRITFTLQAEPIESLPDYDQAKVTANIRVECWHNVPLA